MAPVAGNGVPPPPIPPQSIVLTTSSQGHDTGQGESALELGLDQCMGTLPRVPTQQMSI